MKNSEKWLSMTKYERDEFIAKLVHAIQVSERYLSTCELIVEHAETKGVYNNVIFNPTEEIAFGA